MTTSGSSIAPSPVAALLHLQAHDVELRSLEARATALESRRATLVAEREALTAQAESAKRAAEAEQKTHRELSLRLAAARVELDKRVAAQDAAIRLAEVTAAVAKVEEGRRSVAMLEQESHASRRKTHELTQRAQQLAARAAAAGTAHDAAEAALDAEATELAVSLAPARAQRQTLASQVSGELLGSYDRVRRRRPTDAVVALRGLACSACDTAMPVQRHRAMVAAGRVEVCEGCGVLLFAGT